MKPIYKKREAGLNWMNLLTSGFCFILFSYIIIFKIDLLWELIYLGFINALLLWSFVLNIIEFKILNKKKGTHPTKKKLLKNDII